MTAPLFFVAAGALEGRAVGDKVELDGAEGRHAVLVRRITAGERVDLADGAGERVEGVVASTRAGGGSEALVLTVTARYVEPEPAPRFVLVQALAKGDRDVAAVAAATELGVDEIVPRQAERSVVVWRADRAKKSQNRWAATALAAAKQSRRSRVPKVSAVVTTAELVSLVTASGLALLLHEDADQPLVLSLLPDEGDVLLIVGPEGGIGDGERDRLVAAGATPVRLGSTVLRSSTAGPAALAVLSARIRWA